MLIEQIFELRGPGPPGRICAPITGCFYHKTIICKENFRVDCYSLLKYWRRQCTLLPRTWTKSLTKFNPKMQDLQTKEGLNNLNFFNWLSNVKNLVLSNEALNYAKCDRMALKQLLTQQTTKNRPAGGGFAPRPHSLQLLEDPPPDPRQ